MKKALYLPLFLLASNAALADDAAVLKCRTLPDTAQRLACYDAMPVGAAAQASVPAAIPAAPAAPSAAVPAAAPATAAARTAEQNFGMEKAKKKDEADVMESTVVGTFSGWEGNTTIKLANGQVWRVVDGSSAVLPQQTNPAVRIKRGVFGVLYLQVVGQNPMARVRRIQ
ncbi:hypothetical protein QPK31_09880 [Massilia sp. YIM B02769]|uniref:hypothetical protein n=1 Tax=Massilia sp. YIM B02769 TaxID=3050129 RepID=UPI0025B66CD6|nr:hypothetical protein [Massilia sp. YIM B02769]MDN4058528.1 hypothetical protein [Massilia sp. YIM B02769]